MISGNSSNVTFSRLRTAKNITPSNHNSNFYTQVVNGYHTFCNCSDCIVFKTRTLLSSESFTAQFQ